jgi:hypothetical protein
LKSTHEGMVTMVIHAPQNASGDRTRPTHLMEEVSKILEAALTPLSKNAVEKAIKGKAEWVRIAIQTLIDEKFVGIEHGSRNALNLKSLRQYRQADDSASGIGSFDWQEAENA